MDFIERQSRDFIGREETLNLVKEHIHDGSDVPLVISGADGVGKTSLICKLSSIFSCQTLDRGSGDLIHDSSSKDIQSLTILNGLVLNSKTNYTVDSLQDFLDRLLTFLDFSYDKQVTNHCRNLPTLVREALAIDFDEAKVILLDGIHFFKGTESVPAMLSWLPLKLGKNITVILTVTTNVDSKVFLDELNSRETKPKVIEMSPLEKEEVQQFLKYHLPNKHIGSGLMDQVLAKKDSGNPLWLFFCCLELSHLELWSNVGGVVSKLESMLEDRITQVLVKFPFVNSDDLRCRKIDCDNFKDLIIGTLCLISVSQSGLYENELCEVLSDKDHLLPPLEHVEKGEREKSEKESLQIPQKLPQQIWEQVLKFCLPLLQPSSLPGIFQNGSSKPCFLTFHHPIIKAAVRRVFLDADKDDFSHGQSQGQDQDQNQVQCSKSETSQGTEHYRYKTWWHTKLAKFFENCDNLQRKAEELPYHLKALGDADRLSDYLTEWSTFDLLFKAPFYEAELLLHLWESAGSNEAMSERYRLNLKVNEDLAKDGAKDGSQPREGALLSRDDIMNKYEQVAELMTIAGVYETGIEMAWHAIDVETSELGARPERLATLYDLTSRGYTEIVKMYDFASDEQLPHIQKAIRYGQKAIEIRETFLAAMEGGGNADLRSTTTASFHKHRLGLSLMNLAFNLDSWDACGGNNELSGSDARRDGLKHIDVGIDIFTQFKDDAHKAEALMTKGILSPRGSSRQQKLYNKAMELSRLTFGKYHALTCRLYINIGILHEDNNDYKKAYEYFKQWSDICETVYGKKHPKTVRAFRVLKEPRYQRIAALESGVGGLVNRVLRSAADVISTGSDSNRFLEECHEIAEAEYGEEEEEEMTSDVSRYDNLEAEGLQDGGDAEWLMLNENDADCEDVDHLENRTNALDISNNVNSVSNDIRDHLGLEVDNIDDFLTMSVSELVSRGLMASLDNRNTEQS